MKVAALVLLVSSAAGMQLRGDPSGALEKLKAQVTSSKSFKQRVSAECAGTNEEHGSGLSDEASSCERAASQRLFCAMLTRQDSAPAKKMAEQAGCESAEQAPLHAAAVMEMAKEADKDAEAKKGPVPKTGKFAAFAKLKSEVISSAGFQKQVEGMSVTLGCTGVKKSQDCVSYVQEVAFCLTFAGKLEQLKQMPGAKEEQTYCDHVDDKMPALSLFLQTEKNPVREPLSLIQLSAKKAPEDELAKEMTHDLEMNFNKIAPFGKEDTAKELQDHAAKTQDTLVDAVENAEVAEIKRAVFRALTRLRAATIKEFDTIARLETQAIDAYNDAHHYRAENPLSHLHEDEAPVETDKLKSFH
jgi:hypothetical protein